MILLIEAVVLIVIFTLIVFSMCKEPIKTLYNYPPEIQKRVKSLEQYRDKIPVQKNMIGAKLGFMALAVLLLALMLRFLNGYTTFLQGFGYSYLLWTAVNVYDVLVLDICWFCRDPRFVFPGTEDMESEYRNYRFHIKESLIGELLALPVCLLVGLLVSIF